MPFDRQGSALPPKKRTKLISVPVDGVNLRVVLLSAAYGSVPDTTRYEKSPRTQAVAIEARTNLLFSFEKMALRDGIKSSAGARTFAQGLYDSFMAHATWRSDSPAGVRWWRGFRADRQGF